MRRSKRIVFHFIFYQDTSERLERASERASKAGARRDCKSEHVYMDGLPFSTVVEYKR